MENEVKQEILSVLEKSRIPCAKMILSRRDEALSPLVSKLGGVPYLPVGVFPPRDSSGKAMLFLGQMNFAEVPESGLPLPKTGLLQFWVSSGVGFLGMCFEKGEVGFASIHYPVPEPESQNPNASAVLSKGEPESLPMDGEIACSFEKSSCVWTGCDESFSVSAGVDEDALYEVIDEEGLSDPPFHRVGGYAYFTQSDPRSSKMFQSGEWVLLWQVDTDDDVGLMWGDAGIANVFIKKDDLIAGKFDNLVWNWDCC